MTHSGRFDFLSFREFFLLSSQTSAEGLCKYLYMTLHMRTRHIGTRAATERRRSRRRRVGGEERERSSERAREGGKRERKEGSRGDRETERATGGKKPGQVRQVTAAARGSSAAAACSLSRRKRTRFISPLSLFFLIKGKHAPECSRSGLCRNDSEHKFEVCGAPGGQDVWLRRENSLYRALVVVRWRVEIR